MLLNFSLESFLWKLDRFVQPGCTVKLFAVSPRYFRKFGSFGPPHLLQVMVNAARQLLVDGHQVIGLAGGQKYLSEQGCRHPFFPPLSGKELNDISVPALITEAEKSCLALMALAGR